MSKMKPRTLSGFMELLPHRQAQMNWMMDILRQSYELYGFTGLDTPVIEAAEVLLAKGGGDTESRSTASRRGQRSGSPRFDLTVPLAKPCALHYNDLAFPFRRYQIGKVYPGRAASVDASGSFTRRTSTSSATASWTSCAKPRSPR